MMEFKTEIKPSHLTDKEYRFANYYLGEANLNATEAARLAGYSEHTSRQQGSRLLLNVNIKSYIQSKSSEILERIGVTQEKVLAEIAKIAFSNITEFLNDDWSLKALSEVDSTQSGAIKSLQKSETGFSIQTYDKCKALLTLWELVKDDAPIR